MLVALTLGAASCSAEDTGGPRRRSSAVPDTVLARVTGVGTSGLRVREEPTTASSQLATLAEGAVVEIDCLVEGESVDGNVVWAHVEAKGGYVSDAFLDGPRGFDKGAPRCETSTPSKPTPPTGGGGGPKPVDIDGPAVRPHVQVFADAVCGALDACDISTYAGHSPSAELALDILTSDAYGEVPTDGHAFGDRIAAFALDNQAKYRIEYVIYRQRINMGEGWKGMEDRGSVTQNHFDHVHVSFVP